MLSQWVLDKCYFGYWRLPGANIQTFEAMLSQLPKSPSNSNKLASPEQVSNIRRKFHGKCPLKYPRKPSHSLSIWQVSHDTGKFCHLKNSSTAVLCDAELPYSRAKKESPELPRLESVVWWAYSALAEPTDCSTCCPSLRPTAAAAVHGNLVPKILYALLSTWQDFSDACVFSGQRTETVYFTIAKTFRHHLSSGPAQSHLICAYMRLLNWKELDHCGSMQKSFI